jgi:ABC-type lipoprotein export system ATPase subunit
MYAIELKHVEKKYLNDVDNFKLKDINLKLEYGKIYGIVGHSGNGKSTLLKTMGTLLQPSKGDVLIDDINTSKLNDDDVSKIRMEKIGFVFQDYNLDNDLIAYDNVMLASILNKKNNKKEKEKIINELFEKFNLKNKKNKYPKELSGGEAARVALCRALVNEPSIILADEPTGNLDKTNEKIIFETLKNLAKDGKCVVIVSHSQEIKKYVDEIIEIEDGKIKDE